MINYKPKICKRCKKEFIPNANSQVYCKECVSEVIKSQKRKWKKNHRETINAQKKRHYIKYTEREKARDKINYLKNPEKVKNRVMRWRKKNPEKYREIQKRYRLRHPEKSGQQYYLKNKEQLKQYKEQWRKKNPEKQREIQKRAILKREHNLDFIPLNKYFEGADAHHLDRTYVIYIPTEVHRSIPHSVLKNKNMDIINAVAFNYI